MRGKTERRLVWAVFASTVVLGWATLICGVIELMGILR